MGLLLPFWASPNAIGPQAARFWAPRVLVYGLAALAQLDNLALLRILWSVGALTAWDCVLSGEAAPRRRSLLLCSHVAGAS